MVEMISEDEAPRLKTHSDDLDEEEMGNKDLRLQMDPDIIGPNQIELTLQQDTEYSPKVGDNKQHANLFRKNYL